MSATDDRTFAEVRDRFRKWQGEEQPIAEGGRVRSDLCELLRDYRLGLLTDEAAEDRLRMLCTALYGWGMIAGIHIGGRHPD